jgi:NAD(P)-dependent dehydrogenase (short-subunit alcohol dehydrogenase family)
VRAAAGARAAPRPAGADEAGRVVLVAGASRGIGAAIAAAFAAEGAARVVLAGRTEADLGRVADGVRGLGAQAEVAVADLTDAAQARAVAARAGALDVLVVNAGSNQPEPFGAVSEETFDRLFALNVRAGFFLAQAAAPAMRKGGCIVFVSSQMGHVGAVNRTVYCATKHAVEGLVKALALELAPRGVRVVSVAPTFVRTEMTATQLDDPELGRQLKRQIPLDRYATPEEVADAVVWLASPRAAMSTGSSLLVDGGWTAR